MQNYSIRPELPLDPTTLEILRALVAETSGAGIACMIIGATARDILLTHVFGIPARRATHDVDFAVAVESWDHFEQLKARSLRGRGKAAATREEPVHFGAAACAQRPTLGLSAAPKWTGSRTFRFASLCRAGS